MKNLVQMLFTVLILFSCSSTGDIGSEDSDYSREDAVSSSTKSGDVGGTEPSGNGNQNSEAGIVTAGEWNDLENWDFWNNLNAGFDQKNQENKNDYCTIFTNNRISVLVQNSSVAVANAKVELLKNGLPIWTAKTDNFGKAELWIDLFQKNTSVTLSDYQLKVNNEVINTPLKTFDEGVNTIAINTTTSNSNKVEISFIVDATGSMGDEINFLKDDLLDVLNKVKNNNSSKTLLTASVFYRDEGDDYVTRKSDFSSNITTTISFIKKQNADGGGDYPEAVHSALDVAVNELSWSEDSKTKIAFLLLDAPPHYDTLVIENIQASITKAAAKGIKIIPITASGIDKGTEFLMRFCAILTNGTYTFITNHSGVGNEHIEATVGEYEVEKLNELMVRLINKYSE